MQPNQTAETDVTTLAKALREPSQDETARPILLDVREEWEFAQGHLAGARHVPLRQLVAAERPAERLALAGLEAPADEDRWVVTYCHHGLRSLKARALLAEAGLRQVQSLAGGVDAWSVAQDPTLPRY